MTEDEKRKLHEFWEYMELAQESIIAVETKFPDLTLSDVQEKFEKIFSKELNE